VIRAVMIGIAIAGAGAPTLAARQSQRVRWPMHSVIAVWTDVRSAPPGADALVARALTTWTRAAAGRFVLQPVAAPASALVRIRFAEASGIYGETAPRIDRSTGMIGSAEVLIARTEGADTVRQRIVIYLTALHELGHALGLPHTAVFDDIMYAFSRPDDGERYFGRYQRLLRSADDIGTQRATGLSQADVAALETLYAR
jgi:matrixin